MCLVWNGAMLCYRVLALLIKFFIIPFIASNDMSYTFKFAVML